MSDKAKYLVFVAVGVVAWLVYWYADKYTAEHEEVD